MIRYLKRNQIDEVKYNNCIQTSINSRIYAFSWYLDIVADNWDVLILNDYEAVMPIPWRSKYFIKYVYSPFWVLQLGIFSINQNVNYDLFLDELFNEFKYVNLRMNTGNIFNQFSSKRLINQMQFIYLKGSYEEVFSKYNRNRKRDCRKAKDFKLQERWGDSPKKMIDLFKNNVGKRVSKLEANDYEILLKLMESCIKNGVGEMLSIYSNKGKIVASAFFLKHKHRVTELVCSSDFGNRDNGANTYMNDRAIFKYKEEFEVFNFGGSSMKNISNYYKSFGANTEKYNYINFNNLPFLLRLFKK